MADLGADLPPPLPPGTVGAVPLPGTEPKKKRGGRPRGSLNRCTKDVRTAAAKYTRRALTIIMKLAEESDDPRTQLAACIELLDRGHGKPTMTTLLGGDGGAPVQLERIQHIASGGPRELARRVESLITAAGLADVVEKALADGDADKPALAPTKPNGDAGTSETPETANARPEASNDVEEPAQDDGPQPPPVGKRLVFAGCSVEVEARAQRPGDPPLYVARRDGRELRVGSWSYIELLLKKLLGDPLPRGEIRSTQARSAFHPKAEIARRKIG